MYETTFTWVLKGCNYEVVTKREKEFVKNVSRIRKCDIPPDGIIIPIHETLKIKVNDDKIVNLNTRIEPHGNEVSIKNDGCFELCYQSPGFEMACTQRIC